MKTLASVLFVALLTITVPGLKAQDNPHLDELTKDNVTFIMVDYLDGFMPGIKTIEHHLFIANSRAFARTSKIFDIPTIILGDEGGFRGNFIKEIIDEAPEDAVKIGRHTVSAWDAAGFQETLKKFGRKKIVIGGISIDNCTLITSLDLLRNGYDVYVLVDASGTTSELVENAAIMRLVNAGAVPIGMVMLASEILKDWKKPEGKQVGALYAELTYWGVLGLYKPGN